MSAIKYFLFIFCNIVTFVYLYAMCETQHTFMRKLTAFLLLSVLMYVQGLKTFHRHDVSTVKYHAEASDLFFKSTHECAICDYHLCKDAVLPSIPVVQQTPFYYIVTDVCDTTDRSVNLSDTVSGRGPPARFI
ncbi:hypothetical protein Cpin_5320 [Chitinophaga pinensis DSM 2588]|uniref:Uncharacterized protein n=2 Tax=Chitinophaga pinensis TaxID=79329 RepID=A0A979GXY6_CHIPD|nr:hypothetical protein Cpin_5320 [Chitinophaga pinensis DSM 2588]